MTKLHTFHIPVMGLGFTVDTPLKVARFGITSVVSIVEDELIEEMRKFHTEANGFPYTAITNSMHDRRAHRITAYLNLLNVLIQQQVERLRAEEFSAGSEINKYFELLPDDHSLKLLFMRMNQEQNADAKSFLQKQLREKIVPGAVDVNIMTKCDRGNYNADGQLLPSEFSDAMAALRGFAQSSLHSAVVFSAGLNPRLYNYCSQFSDFYPDAKGKFRKKIILKVSDFRSAAVQGRFFAKKGLWISEYRIESGLNCGGHAFATQGLLMGPILEEFHVKREELCAELFNTCCKYWKEQGYSIPLATPDASISAQGGIGTADENNFLLKHFGINSTGWGSPFLLVPEATNVDAVTLQQLATAEQDDYFVSDASPLGVPFNNFRKSSSQVQRIERIKKNRPGSPCYKKYLALNSEFDDVPICSASREYQHKKHQQILSSDLSETERNLEIEKMEMKECLCEGLGASARIKNNIESPHHLNAVAVCPGPNLAYFSGTFTLKEMIDHIYGRTTLLNKNSRSHMFVNELRMYITHLKKEISSTVNMAKKRSYFEEFQENLLKGVGYYRGIMSSIATSSAEMRKRFSDELSEAEKQIITLRELIPAMV